MWVTWITVLANKGTFKDTSDNTAVVSHYFCPTPECSFKASSDERPKISSCFWLRILFYNPAMTVSKSKIWQADSSPQKTTGTNPDNLGAGLNLGEVQFSCFLTLIPNSWHEYQHYSIPILKPKGVNMGIDYRPNCYFKYQHIIIY